MKTNCIPGIIAISFLFFVAAELPAQDAKAPAPNPTVVPEFAYNGPDRLPLEKADRDRPTMKDLEHGKKIIGRLPNGYRSVVTNSQRDEIYRIQKDYADIVELLKLRIKLMERERDRKIDALLNEDQAAKIRKDLGVLESEKHLKSGAGQVVDLRTPMPEPTETPEEE